MLFKLTLCVSNKISTSGEGHALQACHKATKSATKSAFNIYPKNKVKLLPVRWTNSARCIFCCFRLNEASHCRSVQEYRGNVTWSNTIPEACATALWKKQLWHNLTSLADLFFHLFREKSKKLTSNISWQTCWDRYICSIPTRADTHTHTAFPYIWIDPVALLAACWEFHLSWTGFTSRPS